MKLKGVQYIEKLSDQDLVKLINDFQYLNKEVGVLPDDSEIPNIARIFKEEIGVYDISFIENAVKWEVFSRYERIIVLNRDLGIIK